MGWFGSHGQSFLSFLLVCLSPQHDPDRSGPGGFCRPTVSQGPGRDVTAPTAAPGAHAQQHKEAVSGAADRSDSGADAQPRVKVKVKALPRSPPDALQPQVELARRDAKLFWWGRGGVDPRSL